ncbi:MAG: tetratricopeptide repeat protein [Proteobacteria bacterium]|nr:tetratricopeptide repeat protein [Pseudomonadota bacterium]
MSRPTAHPMASSLAAALILAIFLPGELAAAGLDDAQGGSRYAAEMTRAAALSDQKRWVDALSIYERLQTEAPQEPDVYHRRVMTLADLGSASLAWSLYQARPELFSDAERARLSADRIARLTVWGGFRPLDEPRRLQDMQRAADARTSGSGALEPDPSAPLRQGFDDLVILNGLERHQETASRYRQMRADGIDIPPYALAAAGDSLLALQQPEASIEALEDAAAALPDDIDTQVVLAYAYLESERHADALRHLQKIAANETAWPKTDDVRVAYQNWNRYSADSNLAMIRAYSEDPAGAQAMLAPMTRLAPSNPDLQAKLGIVLLKRGWEDQALERFDVAHTQDPRNLEARIGQVNALVAQQRIDRAAAVRGALLETYPDNVHVQRLDRHWRARSGAQVEIAAARGRS